MKIRHSFLRAILSLCFTAALCLPAGLFSEDLPLPVADPYQMPASEPDAVRKPTSIIRPPLSKPIMVPATEEQRVQELAILELERKLIEQQVSQQIAEAHRNGAAQELKQIIVLNGPVDSSISRATKPPQHGEQKVTLVGINDQDVAKNLENFFGAPLTPEREQAVLDTVKKQILSSTSPDKPVQVRVAGWWPKEGVMAVSVVSGS